MRPCGNCGAAPRPPSIPLRATRLAFLGSPEPAATVLRAVVAAGHDVAIAITRPDKRRGRGGGAAPTPVAATASELAIPVAYSAEDATSVGADLGVVVAYGRIIKPDVLRWLPMVNVHFSLLPRWRGAAPVERAILAGDEQTGVCLMQVEEGLDTGGVYRRRAVVIGEDETASQLTARLAEIGADLLVSALDEGLGSPEPQQGEVTYAAKITPDELHLDWSRPAPELHRVVRVGRAWTTVSGRRVIVLAARPVPGAQVGPPGSVTADVVSTGDGGLRLVTVQPEGKRPMAAAEWLRGTRLDAFDR